MPSIDDILSSAQRARLIPSVADSHKEQRLVSILLAALSEVRPLATQVLDRLGQRVAKSSKIEAYTEVEFPSPNGDTTDRPDGLLCVTTRKSRWMALLEAKIDKADIGLDQVQRYTDIARRFNIDAVITLSNQLVPLSTHVPYPLPKRAGRVQLLHLSWISILTQAQLILKSPGEMHPTEKFILHEMTRYFEHAASGIRRFEQMNAEWRQLVFGIRDGHAFTRTSPEIENTVASWHQEERDICLILSRLTGEQVQMRRLSRRHIDDPELRLRDACETLVNDKELRSTLSVPNTASPLVVTVDLQRRTLTCAMTLNVPLDRQRASARINWLRRQLRGVDKPDIQVRASWPRRTLPTQASLSDVLADAKALESDVSGIAPTGFEILMIRDGGGRFPRPRTFIEDLEKLVPEFYRSVGERLRPWTPPPPSIDKADTAASATTAKPSSTDAMTDDQDSPNTSTNRPAASP